ncbi:MAG: hypothetical protein AMXMBFR83_09040 [Phycisphaerae bacterium]
MKPHAHRLLVTAGAFIACAQVWGAPVPSRSWECIPGVIRDDGTDGFRVTVRLDVPVVGVRFQEVSPRLIPPGPMPLNLRDDGKGGDPIAGDLVFTSGVFRYNPVYPMPIRYWNDALSPAGLDALDVGRLKVEVEPGVFNDFLIGPSVGVLASALPTVTTQTLGPDVVACEYLVNLIRPYCATQMFLHDLGDDMDGTVKALFRAVPDAADFLVFFSTRKVEHVDRLARGNFDAGRQRSVRVDFTGTGRQPFDLSDYYGSRGRLQAIIALDVLNRGNYTGNLVHELTHHWSAYVDPLLGLTDGTGHYRPRSSVGSVLGGQRWLDVGGGSYRLDCTEGVNGATHASPLDKYMMGLIGPDQVGPLHVYSDLSPSPRTLCGQPIIDVTLTVPIQQVQARHGERLPGPDRAQRSFRLGFVAESVNRALTPVEFTYYQMLAEHVVRTLPPEQADPRMGFNWAPITRFFGEGTTWTAGVPRFFDMDGDLDVDHTDFGLVQACYTGTGRGPVPAECDAADADRDRDVDADDIILFQHCFTGPGITINIHCPFALRLTLPAR